MGYPDGPRGVLAVSSPHHVQSLLKTGRLHFGGSLSSRSGPAFEVLLKRSLIAVLKGVSDLCWHK